MATVFISHAAKEDAQFARRLADDLRRLGVQVWIAPQSIRPGEGWVEAIERGLEESSHVVVVLTPAALQSRWVKKETNVAIAQERKERIEVIPLDVEPCRVPLLLSSYQMVCFRRDYEASLSQLADILGVRVPPPEPVRPPRPAPPHGPMPEAEDAGYRDVEERLAETRRQQKLKAQYEQGMARFRWGDWRETWEAMLRASQGEQIELFGSESAKSFDILADEFTDQLCSALGFVRVPDRDRQHKQLYARMIRTPTLHYKLPPRSPLIIFAKQFVEAADVRYLLDLMRILERTISFAFLVTLGEPNQLKALLDQEVFEHDFVVLSRHDLEQILLSRDKVGQLTQTMLGQISLTVISPYRVAGPVPESMFFGRKTEILTIRDVIRDTNVALTGGRRIGKTSILQKVQRILTTQLDCKTLFLDCHAVDTPEIFNRELTEKLSNQLEPPRTFRQAIETVLVVEDKLIVVLLDEVCNLLQHDVEQRDERLFKELRSLSQEGYCNFIFCGGKTLYKRIHNPDSSFFNFCHNVELHFLSEESAARIITQPMSAMGIELKDQDELVARILEVCSCHPNIVQLICKKLVENIKERTISLDDLHAVITSEDFYTDFKKIAWGQATPLEKIVSLAFVEEESFTLSEVYQRLAEFGIENRDAIDDALDTLELYSLITRQGKRYEYALRTFPRIVRETEDTEILIESFARQLGKEA